MRGKLMGRTILLAGALLAAAVTGAQAADAVAGKTVFRRCTPCHDAVQPQNKVGPHLVGVVGRPAGSVAGYRYSANLVELAAGGLTWDEETLALYLRSPKAVVPFGTMAFAGLRQDADIANVIQFLKAEPKP